MTESSGDLVQRLPRILAEVLTVSTEPDGALTVRGADYIASLRVVTLIDGLEMVSLTQPLAWDLPLNAKTRERVARHTAATLLGTVALVEKQGQSKKADVMLRYNFPAAGLTDEVLRDLVLMVLAAGSDVRQDLSGPR